MKSVSIEGHVLFPSKIICIGRNYAGHIEELKNETPSEPVIFLKPNSAISSEIYLNSEEDLDYEGELTFLISNSVIIGVGIGLDLTKRETQARLKKNGLPWERAKAFDNSAVLSRFVKYDGNLSTLRFELYINGTPVQNGGYELMIYKPEDILREINNFLKPEDGDLIMSGSPKGVGKFKLGDEFIGKVYQADKLILESKWVVKPGVSA